jgi:diadenosine tetraphosphate (Ap4A) HIT family hydrolase
MDSHISNKKNNLNSHLTAKERESISFPGKLLLNKNLLKGSVLDFGCGFGKDVEILKQKNIDIVGYDPHYFPNYPTQQYDTIICCYVLNVLLPEEQADVLMNISALLKPNGKAYYVVRRDIVHEGYRIHKIHKKETYQCTIKLPFKTIFKNDSCEIYENQHYTHLNKNKKEISPFFDENEERELIFESATAFSFYDKFPVNKGHALVVPKRLVANYFDLSTKEQTACWIMINKVKEELQNKYNPDGFNIGININETAGQTISHVHIHIIPRYKGDSENPRGGVRGVIPSKQNY